MNQHRSSVYAWGLGVGGMLVLAAIAGANSTEEFDHGINGAGWTFTSVGNETIESTGGNPGAWLHQPLVDTFAPILRSTNEFAPFHGDYRALGVTTISIDARTDAATFGAAGREFSLLLRDTKGTPDVNDDDYAYFVGPLVPQVGQGWVHYDFAVPSASTDPVPAGWRGGWVGDAENFRPGVDWNDVITSVDRVEFWWLNPAFLAIFQQWDVGVDNVTIVGHKNEAYCFGTDADCPCSNGGFVNTGCDNAQATGGVRLEVTAYAPDNAGGGTATLRGSGFPQPGTPTVVVIRSPADLDPAGVLGDGLLCLQPPVVRFGATAAGSGQSVHSVNHGAGVGTFYYQLWYRNNPATFCNPDASNTSNAHSIVWP